jgi:hypothetical protein
MTFVCLDTNIEILKDIDEGILEIENDGQLAEIMDFVDDYNRMMASLHDSLCDVHAAAKGILNYVNDKDTEGKMLLAMKKYGALIDILGQNDSWWDRNDVEGHIRKLP